MEYTNGDVYEGQYFEDYRHGTGLMKYASKTSYYGDWVMGKKQGIGQMRWQHQMYKGQFFNN